MLVRSIRRFCKLAGGVRFVRVVVIRALLFRVYIKASCLV